MSSWRSQTRIQSSGIALSVAYGIRSKPLPYSRNVLKLPRGTSNTTKLVCTISIFSLLGEASPEIAAWPRTIIGDRLYCNVDAHPLAPSCKNTGHGKYSFQAYKYLYTECLVCSRQHFTFERQVILSTSATAVNSPKTYPTKPNDARLRSSRPDPCGLRARGPSYHGA